MNLDGDLPMKTNKLLVAAVLATAIGAPIAGFVGAMNVTQPTASTGVRVPFLHGFPTGQIVSQSELASLERANEWLNSPRLTAQGLRGKVVLVDFWTFTCINWLRTLPYIRAWANTYSDKGLVVIGVHTPEFGVEHDLDNVRRAVRAMGIEYPVAIDNDYAVWNAFANQYWPALYVADAEGRVRHHEFGEGGYDKSERVIRQLLTDAGAVDLPAEADPVEVNGIEAAADWSDVRSPE